MLADPDSVLEKSSGPASDLFIRSIGSESCQGFSFKKLTGYKFLRIIYFLVRAKVKNAKMRFQYLLGIAENLIIESNTNVILPYSLFVKTSQNVII